MSKRLHCAGEGWRLQSAKNHEEDKCRHGKDKEGKQVDVVGQPGFLVGRGIGKEGRQDFVGRNGCRLAGLRGSWLVCPLNLVVLYLVALAFLLPLAIKAESSASGHGESAAGAFLR